MQGMAVAEQEVTDLTVGLAFFPAVKDSIFQVCLSDFATCCDSLEFGLLSTNGDGNSHVFILFLKLQVLKTF